MMKAIAIILLIILGVMLFLIATAFEVTLFLKYGFKEENEISKDNENGNDK